MSTMTIDQMLTHPAAYGRSAQRRRSTVRLTRRGRVVVVLLALLAVLAVGVIVAAGSVATRDSGTPEPTAVVQVGPGDTLWEIASTAAGNGDVRSMIERIEKLNALDSGMLVAGQRLLVPVS
ncbi:LysM peptidoglycan-binding domain-containing protein [Nocardioides sp. YIM 152315]|uniref:LysM peptidoglycan-binding domain-containing protein n=1 Tax=Nocardioides sp. YIM 152315 TaxID=3031760 RepID=UPI0023DBF5D6|nr:LysM peptidoglycan-binding domain-containing protein [Nocardioides sp. YIM 152315]MDF1605686.1 LysM peptidoglycan-binding domain-containing protein [Nocardioides sp. YIM 152315]